MCYYKHAIQKLYNTKIVDNFIKYDKINSNTWKSLQRFRIDKNLLYINIFYLIFDEEMEGVKCQTF